jgi:hypothetical protein
LILSFGNGESFIGYWLRRGVTFPHAVGIAIICGTIDLSLWFRLSYGIRDAYGHARVIYEAIRQQLTIDRLNGEVKWLRHIRHWGLRLYLAGVPQPREYRANGAPYRKHIRDYALLAFYGFVPTGIEAGVGYTVAFHLNPVAAFLVIAVSNTIKMLVFGYMALHVPWKVIAVAVVVGIPTTRFLIEWQHAKHAALPA